MPEGVALEISGGSRNRFRAVNQPPLLVGFLQMKHKIEIQPYSYSCGDGCCSEEGWRWFVDGERVHSSPCYDAGWLAILEKLGIDSELSGLDENGETSWSY